LLKKRILFWRHLWGLWYRCRGYPYPLFRILSFINDQSKTTIIFWQKSKKKDYAMWIIKISI